MVMYAVEKGLHASASESAVGSSGWIDVSEYIEGRLMFDVTIIGTNLVLTIENANEDKTIVATHTTLATITGTGQGQSAWLQGIGKYIRLKWTPTGAATFRAIFMGKGFGA